LASRQREPTAILIIAFNDGDACYLLIYILLMAMTMNIAANNLYNSLGHDKITTASAPYLGSIDGLPSSQGPKHVLRRRS
jgi:hypothetical protein